MDWGTEAMEKFWAEMHAKGDGPALTGSSLANMCDVLGLPLRRFTPGLRLLEIGIGMGKATREMAARGVEVSAMDICNEALRKVSTVARGLHLHRDANELVSDTFDVATSLLVTQHMSETDVLWQFPHVLRSLKPEGRFIVQWAGSRIEGENDLPDTILGQYGPVDAITPVGMISGRMVRTEEHATALIERCGGTVLEVRGRREFPEFKSCWFVTECMRAPRG